MSDTQGNIEWLFLESINYIHILSATQTDTQPHSQSLNFSKDAIKCTGFPCSAFIITSIVRDDESWTHF